MANLSGANDDNVNDVCKCGHMRYSHTPPSPLTITPTPLPPCMDVDDGVCPCPGWFLARRALPLAG